jgi:hypothetical protein
VCLWSILNTISSSSSIGFSEEVIIDAAGEQKLAVALATMIKPLMNDTTAQNQPGMRQILMTAAQSLKWLSDRGVKA